MIEELEAPDSTLELASAAGVGHRGDEDLDASLVAVGEVRTRERCPEGGQVWEGVGVDCCGRLPRGRLANDRRAFGDEGPVVYERNVQK